MTLHANIRRVGKMVRRRQELTLQAMGSVAPRLAASIDWCEGSKHSSWGGPMNGQTGRQEMVRSLLGTHRVARVIETGTHRGVTSLFLAHVSGAPVLSVESNARYYHFARRRFAGTGQIALTLGDSRSFLERLSADPAVTGPPTFFYLDAHWGADCPLIDEVDLICERWSDPVILIDDFAVPNEPAYGFDLDPSDRRFDLHYLPRDRLGGFKVLFPTLPAAEESGARRGCALLATSTRADAVAASEPSLRLQPEWP